MISVSDCLYGFTVMAMLSLLLSPVSWAGVESSSVGTQGVSSNPIIACVNGEEISEAQLVAGLPRTWMGLGGSNPKMKAAKLDRLIETAVIAQYLARLGITIDADAVNADIERLRESPPPAGCSCCRYASLEQYMRDNGFTMNELRQIVANELGMGKAVKNEWERLPATERKPSAYHLDRIQRQYIKVSHIFFNTFQKPEQDSGSVERLADRAAREALRRLQRGESFERVAAEMSEDALSRPSGGMLGMIERGVLGFLFARAVDALKPGATSGLVLTQWGVHIIRREIVTEADIENVFRAEYRDRRRAEIREAEMSTAIGERLHVL